MLLAAVDWTALDHELLEHLLELLHDGRWSIAISRRMMAGCDKSDDDKLQQLTPGAQTGSDEP